MPICLTTETDDVDGYYYIESQGGNKLGNHKAQVLREMDNFPSQIIRKLVAERVLLRWIHLLFLLLLRSNWNTIRYMLGLDNEI